MPWIWYSTLHILVVSAGILLGSLAMAQAPLDGWYLLVACSGAVLVYHVDRGFLHSSEDLLNAPDRIRWMQSHKTFVGASAALFVVLGLIGSYHLDLPTILSGSMLGVIGLIYSAPILPQGKRFKEVPVVKTALILLCWVTGAVVIPVWGSVPSITFWVLITYRMLFLLPNLLMADWIDAPGDRQVGMESFGRVQSLSVLRWITVCSTLVAMACSAVLYTQGIPMKYLLVDGLGLLGLSGMVFFKGEWHSKDVILLDLWVGFSLFTWLVS